jgi:hypothetical protein
MIFFHLGGANLGLSYKNLECELKHGSLVCSLTIEPYKSLVTVQYNILIGHLRV